MEVPQSKASLLPANTIRMIIEKQARLNLSRRKWNDDFQLFSLSPAFSTGAGTLALGERVFAGDGGSDSRVFLTSMLGEVR